MVRPWIANPLFPSSNLGAAYLIFTIILHYSRIIITVKYVTVINCWECGEIGRHDGLKIRCLVIGVRVQVPPFPLLFFEVKIYLMTNTNLYLYIS